MELDPKTLAKLVEIFRAELEEKLQEITNGLIQLEKIEANSTEARSIIECIFRAAHNTKGAARGLGVNDIGEISHHIETLFSSFQKNSLAPSREIIDLCLEAVDGMRSAMLSYMHKSELSFDLNDLLKRLETGDVKKPSPKVTHEQSEKISTANKNESLKETIKETIKEITIEEPQKIIKPSVPKIKQPVAKTPKTVEQPKIEQETIRVSIDNLDRISSLMEEIQINKIAIDDHYVDTTKLAGKTKQLYHAWRQTGYTLNSIDTVDTAQKLFRNSMDNMTEINNAAQNLQKNIHARINELAILSDSLQDEVRTLRLIPAGLFVNTLPRTVRDLAQTLNKKVDLVITGDSVKLDKLVLEGLEDPLMHLIRNSVDHGIEDAATRRALGKPEVGQIHLDIREEGDQIQIAITDDGSGIDVDKIAAIALNKNIVSKAELEAMNENEIIDLIFRPSFSTKEIITDVSGRGVGLDVVRSNLVNLKGNVSLATELNKGTTFNLRVPLTLASERGLMVMSGDQPFVIPTNLIERVLLVKAEDIIEIEASQAVLINEHPIPLRVLANVLNLENHDPDQSESLSIVVLCKNTKKVALLVGDIIGEREIVIKPLHPPLVNIPCLAGGTLAGNGQVIIVLNTNDLLDAALNIGKTERFTLQADASNENLRTHILVVDDSITTRTLEKSVLESKDYQVTVAVNGQEAWDLLQKQKFSLLITDVSMPIMDGFTLTERVKQSSQLSGLPVIIVTSLDSPEEKKRGIDVGADAYIVKQEFESGALLEIVKQLV